LNCLAAYKNFFNSVPISESASEDRGSDIQYWFLSDKLIQQGFGLPGPSFAIVGNPLHFVGVKLFPMLGHFLAVLLNESFINNLSVGRNRL